MKKLLIAALLTITALGTAAFAQPVTFVADIDFAPYSMISEGNPAGIDVEILNEAARRAGIEIEIQFQPWKKVTEMVENGTCDGSFAFFKTPEREKTAIFMEASPLHYSNYVLFTKVGDKFSFSSYDDLTGKSIGRVAGTNLGKQFEEAFTQGKFTLKEYPNLGAALKGLILDEIQAYAGNIDVTYYRLKSMGMTSSIVYLPKKLLPQRPAYMVMSRASEYPDKDRVMQGLERALDQMRKDGTYNKIARRYLLRF